MAKKLTVKQAARELGIKTAGKEKTELLEEVLDDIQDHAEEKKWVKENRPLIDFFNDNLPEEPDEPEEPEEEEPEPDEPEELEEDDGDNLENMDRKELKAIIKNEELDITVKKKMEDDDIREAIREAREEDEPEPDEPEEDEPETEEEDEPETEEEDEPEEEEEYTVDLNLKKGDKVVITIDNKVLRAKVISAGDEPAKVDTKKEKAAAQSTKPNKKTNKEGQTDFGHRIGTMVGLIDEMIINGPVSPKKIAKALFKEFEVEEERALSKIENIVKKNTRAGYKIVKEGGKLVYKPKK